MFGKEPKINRRDVELPQSGDTTQDHGAENRRLREQTQFMSNSHNRTFEGTGEALNEPKKEETVWWEMWWLQQQ